MSGDWRGTLWTLLVTFCIVIVRCTETFWSHCIRRFQFHCNKQWHVAAWYYPAHLICFRCTFYANSLCMFVLQGLGHCHKHTLNISVATTRVTKKNVKYWDFIAEAIILHFDARHCKFLIEKRGKESVSFQFHLIACNFVTCGTNSLQAAHFTPACVDSYFFRQLYLGLACRVQ
jgi:hypothetical protein